MRRKVIIFIFRVIIPHFTPQPPQSSFNKSEFNRWISCFHPQYGPRCLKWTWSYVCMPLYDNEYIHRSCTRVRCNTLTPPDTWSCPFLRLAYVLILRPISPEFVLFPDFWLSNIPRYFCFAYNKQLPVYKTTVYLAWNFEGM